MNEWMHRNNTTLKPQISIRHIENTKALQLVYWYVQLFLIDGEALCYLISFCVAVITASFGYQTIVQLQYKSLHFAKYNFHPDIIDHLFRVELLFQLSIQSTLSTFQSNENSLSKLIDYLLNRILKCCIGLLWIQRRDF